MRLRIRYCRSHRRTCQCCDQERIVGTFAFHPPHPSTYSIHKENDTIKVILDIKKIHIEYEDGKDFEIQYLSVGTESIILFHIKSLNPRGALIFCHGNAVDCGPGLPRCISLSKLLQFDVFTFDYHGYGLSSGKPTESNLYHDIRVVYDYVTKFINQNIYLYGEIGSVPCCYLGSQKDVHIHGMILHSAVVSGGHILRMNCLFKRCNPFNNLKYATKIHIPVFQIHAINDHLIPLKHAKYLEKVLHSNYKPWYVSGCNHTTIPSRHWSDYCEHIYKFIEDTISITNEELYNNNNNINKKQSNIQIEMIEYPSKETQFQSPIKIENIENTNNQISNQSSNSNS